MEDSSEALCQNRCQAGYAGGSTLPLSWQTNTSTDKRFHQREWRAKNFSIFSSLGGRYRMTPLYDVISAQRKSPTRSVRTSSDW